MPIPKIPKDLNDQTYFLTFTVKSWYYVLDRQDRWRILSEALNYCVKNKGLKVYAYAFMLNHIHLLVESLDVSGFVRDYKKYTAKQMFENMQQFEPAVADLFKEVDGSYSFWKKDNMPILVESEYVFAQKKTYIENNPVVKSYVNEPEHWVYSSANKLSPVKTVQV